MQKLLTYSTLLVAFWTSHQAFSQDQGFMYGRVTTIDGKSYEGALRWGKEEAYWTDMFNNISKNPLPIYQYLFSFPG